MSYEDDLKTMEKCEVCEYCELDPTGRVQGHYCQKYNHELEYVGIITIRECQDWFPPFFLDQYLNVQKCTLMNQNQGSRIFQRNWIWKTKPLYSSMVNILTVGQNQTVQKVIGDFNDWIKNMRLQWKRSRSYCQFRSQRNHPKTPLHYGWWKIRWNGCRKRL